MRLGPCTSCARHVDVDAPQCPFCGAAMDAAREAYDARARAARADDRDDVEVYGAPGLDEDDAVAPLYGAPPDDLDDDVLAQRPPAPVYGAPPPFAPSRGGSATPRRRRWWWPFD